MIGFAQQGLARHIARPALLLGDGIELAAVVIDHLHAKAMRAPACDGLTDTAHAQNAQGAAMHVAAQQCVVTPFGPVAVAQPALGLGHAARSGQQQGKAEIGRGFGQHVRCVGGQHANCRQCGQIQVVVTHSHIGTHAQPGTGSQHLCIDDFRRSRQDGIATLQVFPHLIAAPERILGIVHHVEMLAQALHHIGEDGTGHQQARSLRRSCMHGKQGLQRRRASLYKEKTLHRMITEPPVLHAVRQPGSMWQTFPCRRAGVRRLRQKRAHRANGCCRASHCTSCCKLTAAFLLHRTKSA